MALTHEEASTIVSESDIGPHCHGNLEGVKKAMEAEPRLAEALSALDYRREDEIPQHAAAHPDGRWKIALSDPSSQGRNIDAHQRRQLAPRNQHSVFQVMLDFILAAHFAPQHAQACCCEFSCNFRRNRKPGVG